jgi:hypothetical protein
MPTPQRPCPPTHTHTHRNFQGFAKELFTDAGKYVIHFGYRPERAAEICQATVVARSGREDVSVTPMAVARTDVAVIPTFTGNQLVRGRRLGRGAGSGVWPGRAAPRAARHQVQRSLAATRVPAHSCPPTQPNPTQPTPPPRAPLHRPRWCSGQWRSTSA